MQIKIFKEVFPYRLELEINEFLAKLEEEADKNHELTTTSVSITCDGGIYFGVVSYDVYKE